MATIKIDYQTTVDQAVADVNQVNEAVGGKTPTAVQNAVGAFTELKAKLDLASMAFGAVKGAVESAINPVMDYAKNVRDLAAFTGLGIEQSSELVNVADDLGIEFRTLQQGAKTLAEQGLQPSVATLAALSDQFSAIQDPVEQSQFLIDHFGARAGPEFAYALQQGSAALLQMGEDAHAAGLVIDEEVVANARAAEVAMDNWGDSVLAAKIALSETLLPAMTTTVSAGADWLTMWRLNTEALAAGEVNLLEWAAAGMEVTWTGQTLEGKIEDLNAKLAENDSTTALAAHTLRENYEPATADAVAAVEAHTTATSDNVMQLQAQDQWLADIADVGLPAVTEEAGLAAAAMQDYSEKLLFNQVSAGLNEDAQLLLAASLGIIDTATLSLLTTLPDLTAQFDTNGNGAIDAGEDVQGYVQALLALNTELSNLDGKQTSSTHTHVTNYVATGYDLPDDPDQPAPFAAGGAYGSGPRLVGEMGPEVDWPNRGGFMMDAQKSDRLLNALEALAGGGAGATYNIYGLGGAGLDSGLAQTLAGAY